MKNVLVLVVFLFAGSVLAQDESCTLTLNAETGIFVADNCTESDLGNGIQVSHEDNILTFSVTNIVIAEQISIFQNVDSLRISLASDVLDCHEGPSTNANVVTQFENEAVVETTGQSFWNINEQIMFISVSNGENTCWIAEANPTGNPVWVVDSNRVNQTEVQNFEVGDIIVVQGEHSESVEQTIALCRTNVDGNVQTRLFEDTWVTVISGPVESGGYARYEVRIGYTDETCWVANGTNPEIDNLPWFGLLEG